MATVSRGEITITNMYDGIDGQTFYPHYGYLMADGTLVNQVPGVNDLRIAQSKFVTQQGSTINLTEGVSVPEWGATDAIRHVVSGGTNAGVSATMRAGGTVKAGVKYVHSAYIKNQGTTKVKISNNLGQSIDVDPGETKRIIFNPSGSENGIAAKQFVLGRSNASDVQDFILWRPKIEESDTTATYWTPSPLDDYENAYPKYEGFYSDTNQADSTDPDKYKPWVPFMGQKGDKGDKGDNAPTISLSGATQVITVSKTGVITPSSSFTVVGTPVNTTITTWLYSVDGGAFVTTLPTGVTRATNTVTINPATSTFKTLSIRAADATVMDIFTIARIIEARDGTDGANGKDGTNGTNGSNGADGKDAYTVILSNEAYTFPGSTTGALAGSTTTTISVYKGITKINPTSITVGTKPTGMTSTVSGAVVTFTVTTAMVTKGGTVPIDIVVDGLTFNKLFSYAISLQGIKGTDGGIGPQGPPGVDGKEVFSGYLSNDSILVPANNAGTVTDFSKANGTFTTFLGQVQLTSGVVYSLVSNSGLTSTINATTGAYSVTAISADTATATYKAVYNGITIQKILIVTKAKQGPTGATGATGTTGAKGDPTGIIAQTTAPTSPYVGMLWKNTTAGNGATYRWTGSAWEAYVFTAVNISVENLAAIVTRIGEIYNDYSRTYNDGTTAVGTLSLKDAEITNNGVIKNSSGTIIQSYNSIYSHQLISLSRYEGSTTGDQTKLLASAGLTFDTLSLMSKDTGFSGTLTAEMLYDTGWIELPLLKGAGSIRCRKFMKRYLIQFYNYKWDAAGPSQPADAVAQLPANINPKKMQLFNLKVWSIDPQRQDAWQLNEDGKLYKLSNNSTTLYYRQTIEVFD